ncbi:MAG TPA: HD domain-containing protein [Streptosporangiaceae bacterium]|nr:HD domain-containing protein [Streptosporangiaceae bacterium]
MRTFTDWHTWPDAAPGLSAVLPGDVVARVAGAVQFATGHHGDQRRKTGVPYLEHLLEAVQILVQGAGVRDPDVLVAAVLHDVVEDTPCTLDEIAAGFGPRAAELVSWVTMPERCPGEDASAVREAYLRRLRLAPQDAILVKLADRMSNVQTLRNLAPDRQRSYYAQTVEHIIPLTAAQPWFAAWYAEWEADFADLAAKPS